MSSLMKDGRYRLMANPNTYSRVTCSAYGCDMRSGTNALSEIKMYLFPKEPYRRRRWELATRRANWKAHTRSRLCSKHFITGKPSKDPKHPDYVPSIFVFTENVHNLKKSMKQIEKKMNCKDDPPEAATKIGNASSHKETCTASCSTCISPESVSSAVNMSLAPLNQSLSQLMDKLREMEEERELLRTELAHYREEMHQLREEHQHCQKKSHTKRRRSKSKNVVSIASASDASEILESIYTVESTAVDDPDEFHSLDLEQNYLQPSNKPSRTKRKKEDSDEVIGIIEQCTSSKKVKVKDSNLKSLVTSEESLKEGSSDPGSPITIVYLKR